MSSFTSHFDGLVRGLVGLGVSAPLQLWSVSRVSYFSVQMLLEVWFLCPQGGIWVNPLNSLVLTEAKHLSVPSLTASQLFTDGPPVSKLC